MTRARPLTGGAPSVPASRDAGGVTRGAREGRWTAARGSVCGAGVVSRQITARLRVVCGHLHGSTVQARVESAVSSPVHGQPLPLRARVAS
jgi:hypothetical protein